MTMPALEVADRFLRELGVRVAEQETPAASYLSQPGYDAVVQAKPEAPRATPNTQVLAPPAPIVDLPSERSALRDVALESPAQAQAGAARWTAPARASATDETRRVLVVERSRTRDGDGVAGGGAPHFGLGQL
jgi:hypothetical protein